MTNIVLFYFHAYMTWLHMCIYLSNTTEHRSIVAQTIALLLLNRNLTYYAFPNRSKSFLNRSRDRFPINFDVSDERQWFLRFWNLQFTIVSIYYQEYTYSKSNVWDIRLDINNFQYLLCLYGSDIFHTQDITFENTTLW